MTLDAVSETFIQQSFDAENIFAERKSYEKWCDFPVSKIRHHKAICCETALAWLLATDYSQLMGDSRFSEPVWISHRYKWGPTHWHIHWCEALEQEFLDCGAQAAIAQEVFRHRGIQSFRVQLVQQYSVEATAQWQLRWNDEQCSSFWINDDLIFHEGCAVINGDSEIKIWDASAGCWIDSRRPESVGYGSLLALRLHVPKRHFSKNSLMWRDRLIIPNQWIEI